MMILLGDVILIAIISVVVGGVFGAIASPGAPEALLSILDRRYKHREARWAHELEMAKEQRRMLEAPLPGERPPEQSITKAMAARVLGRKERS